VRLRLRQSRVTPLVFPSDMLRLVVVIDPAIPLGGGLAAVHTQGARLRGENHEAEVAMWWGGELVGVAGILVGRRGGVEVWTQTHRFTLVVSLYVHSPSSTTSSWVACIKKAVVVKREKQQAKLLSSVRGVWSWLCRYQWRR
jgi:hypothetical protein